MASTSTSLSIDLSALPAPLAVKPEVHQQIWDARIADLTERLDGKIALVASDPAIKLQGTDAYRELLTLAEINDRARAVMLAFAVGSDLDMLGAFYRVRRLVISPATGTSPAVMEDDTSLRRRIQLAPEEFARTGLTGGAYVSRALRAHPTAIRDAVPLKREGGHVDVIVMGRSADGSVIADDVARVAAAFADDDATQLTDIVTVRAVRVVPYQAAITLQLPPGPDATPILAQAEAMVRGYAESRHRIGQTVYRQGLEAAAKVGGVEQAIAEHGDVVPGRDGVAWMEALQLSIVRL